jgi:hypothetical protein
MLTLERAVFMQAGGQPTTDNLQTVIYGWGQYKDEVRLLPKSEQDKVDQLADQIVSSFAQTVLPPFRSVIIDGHADKDWHGEKLENAVSFARAQAVQNALTVKVRQLWEQRKMGPPPPGGVVWDVNGKGAKHMIAPAYSPQNRRVVVTLIRTGAPLPPPPAPDTLDKRVDRLLKLMATRKIGQDTTGRRTGRAKCMLPKLLRPGVIDVFVDGGIANETINGMTPNAYDCIIFGRNAGWLGNYDGTKNPMPQSELVKFLSTLTPILKGAGFAPGQSDDHVLDILGVVVQNIEDGINMVDNYILRMGMMSDPWVTALTKKDGFAGDVARKKLQSLYRNNLNDPNNIYSCYA